jgi:ABC-type transporter Mla MlaB component
MGNNEDFSINIASERNTASLIFSGDLTIRQINRIYQELNVPENKELKVIIRKVDFIDLTFIQLLVSIARQHMNKKGNSFSFEPELDHENQDLLKKTGFFEFLNIYQTKNHGTKENHINS